MKKGLIVLMVFAIIVLNVGCDKKSNDNGSSPLAVESSSQALDANVDAFGVVKSKQTKDIVIKFPAYLESLNVKNGQKVKKGDILATLNIDDYNAQIKDKESQLSTIKAQSNGSSEQRKAIDALSNEIDIMKEKLNGSNVIQNKIVSDIDDGIVYDINYMTGDFINGDTKVLSILNSKDLIIELDVPEEYITRVKIGAQVDVKPSADKSRTYSGKVTSISNKATQNNGQTVVPVEVALDNYDGLMVDFNVEAYISISGK